MNLAELTRDEIDRFGEHVNVIYEGREYTNVQLREEGLRLAAALRELGVGRGDRVIIQMPNCPEVLESFGASYALGAVNVPINFMVGDDETAYIYRDSGTETIISSMAFLPKIEACRKQAPNIKNVILIDKEVPAGILSFSALFPHFDLDLNLPRLGHDITSFLKKFPRHIYHDVVFAPHSHFYVLQPKIV